MKRHSLLLAAAVLAGGFARFLHLGARSLWLDEAISLEIARLDFRNFLSVISRREVNMSLYYVLLHFWIRLGQNEFTLRALSAVFGTLVIVAIYALASEWMGKDTGMFACWLAALNPALVAYSQEARAYSFAVLLAVVSFLVFRKALDSGEWAHWVAYGVIDAMGMYAHLFFGWLVVAQLAYLTYAVHDSRTWKRVLVAYVFLGASLVPLVAIFQRSAGNQLAWIVEPNSKALLRFFADASGSGLLAGLYGLFAVAGWLVLGRKGEPTSSGSRILLALWWLAPVLLAFAISRKLPIFVPRYLLICIPPMLMLAAVGLSANSSRRLRWLGLSLVLAASIYGTYSYHRSLIDERTTNDWRGAADYMAQVLRSGDRVLFYYGAERLPFDFYFRQNPKQGLVEIYPSRPIVDLLVGKASTLDEDLLYEMGRQRGRIFLLSEFQPNERWRRTVATLNSGCSRTDRTHYFGFVRIDQLDCDSVPAP